MRVLIVKPSSFGDVIHALPVAAALKKKSPGGAAALLAMNPSTLRARMRKLHIAFGRQAPPQQTT